MTLPANLSAVRPQMQCGYRLTVASDTVLQEHGAALLGRCETAGELAEVEAAVRAAIQGWKRRTAATGALCTCRCRLGLC